MRLCSHSALNSAGVPAHEKSIGLRRLALTDLVGQIHLLMLPLLSNFFERLADASLCFDFNRVCKTVAHRRSMLLWRETHLSDEH